MIKPPIKNAIITAAGKGERMRPLTNDGCKPMVMVAGQPIIGHVLDRLIDAGVTYVAVNTHYKPDSLIAYLQQYAITHPGLTIKTLHEDELLDTGGGIKNLLRIMPEPDQPFYVISGDSYWEDSAAGSVLTLMADSFDPTQSDIMLLLKKLKDMHPTAGSPDYDIDEKLGKPSRSMAKTGSYAWTSVRIIKNHAVFDNTPQGAFSFLTLMDRAEKAGRLQGLLHEGAWHHFSTPADVAAINNLTALQKKTVTEEPPQRRAPAIGS